MPYINVRVSNPDFTTAQTAKIQRGVTLLMAEVLNKKTALTAVQVEICASDSWSIGGEIVPLAVHLEANITAGTNSDEEKSRFISKAHDLLLSVLGTNLPTATYVIVREIPADAWGYSGETQAHRAGIV